MTETRDWGNTEFRQALHEVLPLYPKLWKLLSRISPFHFFTLKGTMVISAFFTPAIIWGTKFVVDGVVEALNNDLSWLVTLIPVALILGLWVAQMLVGAIQGIVMQIYGTLVDIKSRGLLLEKAASLDLAFFESPRFYDKLHHAERERWALTSVHESTLNLVGQLITVTSLFAILTTLHPLAILVLVITMIPNVVIEVVYIKLWYKLDSETVREWRMADYMTHLVVSREAAKEVRTYSLKDYLVSKFKKNVAFYFSTFQKHSIKETALMSGANLLGYLGIGVIWLYAVYEAVNGRISIGDFTMITLATEQVRSGLLNLVSSVVYTVADALTLTWYFQFIEFNPDSVTGALDKRKPTAKLATEKPVVSIEFRGVSFSYPDTDKLILDGISFSIKPNKKLAIVGENGAGKTTLIKLLTRLYDPSKGNILLNGQDLRDYDLNELRDSMSIVFQDFARYDVSVEDNIGWGRVKMMDNKDLIRQAAIDGGVHSAIEALPSGYETILGRTFEEGVDLSGGEWQNIAIARAFFADRPLLILDEPSAALDAFNEQALYERIMKLGTSKTVVFISHRFSTVRMADEIVVVDNGKIVEQGSHYELMKIDGKYRHMFSRQASRYVD